METWEKERWLKKAIGDNTFLERAARAAADHMSPPGSFKHVPKRLDEARLKYGIPDAAFRRIAMYDRIFIFQLPDNNTELAWEGSSIIAPESAQQREIQQTPRGVLVSAGLRALDELRSNGIDLGHVVNFNKLAPYRLRVATLGAIEFHLLVMRSGDVMASETLYDLLQEGRASIEREDGKHLVRFEGQERAEGRRDPFIPDDY